MPAKQQNFSIKAGEGLTINLVNTRKTTTVTNNCYEDFRETPAKSGYSFQSERIDSNGNRIGKFCFIQENTELRPFNSDCFVLVLKFTSAYGPQSSDPNKMYYVGKESVVEYSTSASPISQLYTITYNKPGGALTFNFTSLGTTPYQVDVNKTSHALGAAIGNREEAYGMPFTSADYELWAVSTATKGVVMEGTITVDGGLTGGNVACT